MLTYADVCRLLMTSSADSTISAWALPSGEKRFQISFVGAPPDASPALLALSELDPAATVCDIYIYLALGTFLLACKVSSPLASGALIEPR
jgi:hypothetical protein